MSAEHRQILLDEHVLDDGTVARTWLRADGDELALVEPDGARPLPDGAVAATFARFGGELSDDLAVPGDGALDLGGGARLVPLRHLARYDVIARDYLVLTTDAGAPRVALAVTIAGALRHLARAAERNAP